MAYSIALGSGTIRLGENFNSQFYNGASLTSQNSLASDRMRNYSNGGGTHGSSYTGFVEDKIPYSPTAQRSMSMYRGGTGAWGYSESASDSSLGDQAILTSSYGGPVSIGQNYAKTSNTLVSGAASGVDAIKQAISTSNAPQNAAVGLVQKLGYLEPGTYMAAYSGGTYNIGRHIFIVRGYSQDTAPLSGPSSNYLLLNKAVTFSGSYGQGNVSTIGSQFTVNATYPYVIIALETHCDNEFYLETSVNRKESTGSYRGSNRQLINPCVWRIA